MYTIERVIQLLERYRDHENRRIDRIIADLREYIAAVARPDPPLAPRPGRGRRFMGEAERRAVSERMKRYWADRNGGAK